MFIVVEGPDNTGKSTLCQRLSADLEWPVVKTLGPERYPGEIEYRIDYLSAKYPQDVIFDRHPCVSQNIYGALATGRMVAEDQRIRFYNSCPIFIYCHPSKIPTKHITKNYDTDEHVKLVMQQQPTIHALYLQWARQHAMFVYTIGDDMQQLSEQVLRLVALRTGTKLREAQQ